MFEKALPSDGAEPVLIENAFLHVQVLVALKVGHVGLSSRNAVATSGLHGLARSMARVQLQNSPSKCFTLTKR